MSDTSSSWKADSAIYYHALCEQHWPVVLEDKQLTPQELPSHFRPGGTHDLTKYFEMAHLPLLGLCIWPEHELDIGLVEDFLLWRFSRRLGRTVRLLELTLYKEETFSGVFNIMRSEEELNKIKLWHILTNMGERLHEKRMDFLIKPLPLYRVRTVGMVSLETTLDRKLLGKDLHPPIFPPPARVASIGFQEEIVKWF